MRILAKLCESGRIRLRIRRLMVQLHPGAPLLQRFTLSGRLRPIGYIHSGIHSFSSSMTNKPREQVSSTGSWGVRPSTSQLRCAFYERDRRIENQRQLILVLCWVNLVLFALVVGLLCLVHYVGTPTPYPRWPDPWRKMTFAQPPGEKP